MSSGKKVTTLSFSNFPNIVIDRDFKVLAFNKKASEDIKNFMNVILTKGNPVFDYIIRENHEKTRKLMLEAFNGNFIRDVFSFRHMNGEIRFWEYYYKPVYSENNNITAVSISGIDVTELKLKEISLLESEARYKGIVESQRDLVMRLDLSGKLTFANQRMCEVLGKTNEEILGNSFTDTIHPDDLEYTMSEFARIMHPPYRTSGEVRGMTVDGWKWYHWESTAIRNDKGELVEIQGVCRDVTEKKELLVKLSETNELLTAIMRSSPAAIIVFDFSGKITYWNKSAEKIFGWTENEVLNKNNPSVPESDKNNFLSRLTSIQKGKVLNLRNIERLRKDGSIAILDAVGVPLRDQAGKIFASLAIYNDITDRINAEIENIKLSSVLNLSTGAIAILDKNLEIESVNPKFTELTGYTIEELKGLKLKDIRPPRMPLEEYYKIEGIIRSGSEFKSEAVNRSKSGNIYYENVLISPIRDTTGAVSNYLLIKEDISERNKALQELINTRLRLGSIMNSLPNLLIFEFGTEFTFISANIKEVLGYPREKFIENPGFYREIIDREDLEKFGIPYGRWLNSDSNDIFSGIMRFRKPDNEVIWIEMFISKVRTESSVEICGLAVDITDSKRSQEKLEWNETLLTAMTDSTRYGYYAVDLKTGGILYVNERFCEIWGVTEAFEDISEKKITNAEVLAMCSRSVHEPNQFYLTNEKYSDPSNTITFEDEVELLSGRVLRRFSSLLKDKNGNYIGRFYMYEDITEKKLYERMANMQNDYRLLVEESLDSMVISDLKGNIKVANAKFCSLTGYGRDEISSLSYPGLFDSAGNEEIPVSPEDSLYVKTLIRKRFLKRKDGAPLSVETRSKMLPNKLIQTVFSETGRQDLPGAGHDAEGIPNVYANILTKLRLFRHGENSLSCLNRISLFLKNFGYLNRPEDAGVSSEMKERFFILAEEFTAYVRPQLDYIVALMSNLVTDSPNVEFQGNITALKDAVSRNSGILEKNLMELYESIKTFRQLNDFGSIKNEIISAVSGIKKEIKFITMLLEESYVADAPGVISRTAQKFRDTHPNAEVSLKTGIQETRIVFSVLDLQELINILLVNSAEAADSKKKKLKITMALAQAGGKTILEYSDNARPVPARIRGRIFESGVTTKGTDRGFGLNFAAKTVKKYGGKIMLGPENGSGVKFIVELNPY